MSERPEVRWRARGCFDDEEHQRKADTFVREAVDALVVGGWRRQWSIYPQGSRAGLDGFRRAVREANLSKEDIEELERAQGLAKNIDIEDESDE